MRNKFWVEEEEGRWIQMVHYYIWDFCCILHIEEAPDRELEPLLWTRGEREVGESDWSVIRWSLWSQEIGSFPGSVLSDTLWNTSLYVKQNLFEWFGIKCFNFYFEIIIHRKLRKIFFPLVASSMTVVQHQHQEIDSGTRCRDHASISCALACGGGGCSFVSFSCVHMCKPPPPLRNRTAPSPQGSLCLLGKQNYTKSPSKPEKSLHKNKWKIKKKNYYETRMRSVSQAVY